jgi:hypothetical protein
MWSNWFFIEDAGFRDNRCPIRSFSSRSHRLDWITWVQVWSQVQISQSDPIGYE